MFDLADKLFDLVAGVAADRLVTAAETSQAGLVPLPDVRRHLPRSSSSSSDFDAEELAAIDRFLEDASIRAFIQIGIAALLSAKRSDRSDVNDSLRDDFLAATALWCVTHGETWNTASDKIWDALSAIAVETFGRLSESLGEKEVAELFKAIVYNERVADTPLRYVEIVRRLVRDRDEQQALSILAERVRHASVTDTFPIQGDEDATFADLYVERDLTDSITGERIAVSSALSATSGSFRSVVIGDPGTGKSTLTRWIKWHAHGSETGPTPIIVVARTLLAGAGTTIFSALASAITMQVGSHCDELSAEALLATGQILPIVDGVDELQVRSRRMEVVSHLEATQRNFPSASFLCTTRRTGYEVPSLRAAGFRVLALSQYSEEQTREYVSRWFDLADVQDRAQRFLGESRDLPDLRQNPLMLSLLCNLYRQQDYIPQSRRDVYQRCSELMFKEWDPKRGIDIPAVFKTRGTKALYAIAKRISELGGYGKEVSGSELQRIVYGVLLASGVDDDEASISSRELVAHCSDRAWILSKTGSTDTESLYGFTHRTFFEYFAAEAIVRDVNRRSALGHPPRPHDSLKITEMTRTVRDAYMRDTSSVMPELILQATEAMSENGQVIIEDLIKLARYNVGVSPADEIALAVRLLTALGGDKRIAEKVLDEVSTLWRAPSTSGRSDIYSLSTFRYLLDLPSAHRRTWKERLSVDEALQNVFASQWARLQFLDETSLYDSGWAAFVREKSLLETADDVFVRWSRGREGASDLSESVLLATGVDLFYLTLDSAVREGPFWQWIARGESDQSDRVFRHALAHLVSIPFTNESTPDLVPSAIPAKAANLMPLRLALALMVLGGAGNDDRIALVTDFHDSDALTKAGQALRAVRSTSLRASSADLPDLERAARDAIAGVGKTRLLSEMKIYLVLGDRSV